MIGIITLSDTLKTVSAGTAVKIPCTIGMAKFYRKEIEDYVLKNTTEPILIAISPTKDTSLSRKSRTRRPSRI